MSLVLTVARVDELFRECLFKEGEATDAAVIANGIMINVGFHPGRLESHRHEIRLMLAELPDTFKADSGGGWSFLNACLTNTGELWTGDQRAVEELCLLGIATGQVEFMLDRELWSAMPGGMPYLVVKI